MKEGRANRSGFWRTALDTWGLSLLTPEDQLDEYPVGKGPIVICVANHPHGLVDGMILADLIGRVAADYKILTRALLLTGIDEVANVLHDPGALSA